MPSERLATWIEQGYHDYVDSRIQAGETREVAEDNARRNHSPNFPDGAPLAWHRVFDIVADGETVGFLWIAPQLEGSDQWWVYDIEIAEHHRRKGYGRAALELGHQEARALGATAIGLNVFGFNTGARELYGSLGYEVTAVQMKKQL
jgi:GNAT superfamily N-acetyltransferase